MRSVAAPNSVPLSRLSSLSCVRSQNLVARSSAAASPAGDRSLRILSTWAARLSRRSRTLVTSVSTAFTAGVSANFAS